MKKFVWLILILAISSIMSLGQSDDIEQAQIAYETGSFSTAIQIYEGIVDKGVDNENLYFNLGSAYLQHGDIGKALLNYRRAQQYIPRDTELNEHIARLRIRRTNIQESDIDFLNAIADGTVALFTIKELSTVAFALWVVWFLLVAARILAKRGHDVLRITMMGVGLLLIVSLLILGARLYTEQNRPEAVITVSSTIVMSGPGEDYVTHFELFNAAEVRILDQKSGWLRFSINDGRQGWLREGTVEFVSRRD